MPQEPDTDCVIFLPTSRVVNSALRSLDTGSVPHIRNFCAPSANVPSGHGSQLGMSRLMVQKSPSYMIGAVQPPELLTSPVHSMGLLQVVAMFHVSMTVRSSLKTSLVLAHCPFDVDENVPLRSGAAACAG